MRHSAVIIPFPVRRRAVKRVSFPVFGAWRELDQLEVAQARWLFTCVGVALTAMLLLQVLS